MRAALIICMLCMACLGGWAQEVRTSIRQGDDLDSLRKKLEAGGDSVVFTARYIKYTNLKLSADSVMAIPLDTTIRGFQLFNVLQNPLQPTVGLGNLGLAAQTMFYNTPREVGFNTGYNGLDIYKRLPDELTFYSARTPYTSLYYINGSLKEQLFRATHSRNVNNNLNVTGTLERIGADGFYTHQRGDVLNGSLNAWYKTPNKRYIVFAGAIWNRLKAEENGAVLNDSVYTVALADGLRHVNEPVRLNNARQFYRSNYYFARQSYNIGRVDSVVNGYVTKILPTNKLTHYIEYSRNGYAFIKNEADYQNALPRALRDSTFSVDSTGYERLRNDFSYTFFLRAGNTRANELRVSAGIRNDLIFLKERTLITGRVQAPGAEQHTYQNNWLMGTLAYRFSDKLDAEVNVQQVFVGHNAGDFDYNARANVFINNHIGAVDFFAGIQNRSPELLYNHYNTNFGNWNNDFNNTKTTTLRFEYFNPTWQLRLGGTYNMVSNYLYLQGAAIGLVKPAQYAGQINLLQLNLYKWFKMGRFNLETYLVYQLNNNKQIIHTPDFYTYNSFYFKTRLFKVLNLDAGIDVRYNSKVGAYSYYIPAGKFYNGAAVTFKSYPVGDVFVRANLKRASLLLKYSYANQKLLSNGFYTVNRYPMQDAVFSFGVQWNFYD